MELGEKIRQARLEAGLSQRQLCAGQITRNMLSQIEHGTARPSMDTLRLLAAGVGKPVSYFLEDEAVTSPNQDVMARSREAFRRGGHDTALEILENYRAPDPVFDDEKAMLQVLCRLELAERAIRERRLPYARNLLEQAGDAGGSTPYYTPAMERQRLLLLSQAEEQGMTALAGRLPGDDRELLLRARAALEAGDGVRALAYLEAAQDRGADHWHLLRGEAFFTQGDYAPAAEAYRLAEASFPRQVAARLEICYRELGDFRLAYEYACKQRSEKPSR